MDTTKTRTITLTDRPPVRIREADWPVIASAVGDSRTRPEEPDYETDDYAVRVRQHADGRTIVYSVVDGATTWTGTESRREGELLDAGADVAAAIRRVGEEAEIPDHLIRDCIADLPAVELV